MKRAQIDFDEENPAKKMKKSVESTFFQKYIKKYGKTIPKGKTEEKQIRRCIVDTPESLCLLPTQYDHYKHTVIDAFRYNSEVFYYIPIDYPAYSEIACLALYNIPIDKINPFCKGYKYVVVEFLSSINRNVDRLPVKIWAKKSLLLYVSKNVFLPLSYFRDKVDPTLFKSLCFSSVENFPENIANVPIDLDYFLDLCKLSIIKSQYISSNTVISIIKKTTSKLDYDTYYKLFEELLDSPETEVIGTLRISPNKLTKKDYSELASKLVAKNPMRILLFNAGQLEDGLYEKLWEDVVKFSPKQLTRLKENNQLEISIPSNYHDLCDRILSLNLKYVKYIHCWNHISLDKLSKKYPSILPKIPINYLTTELLFNAESLAFFIPSLRREELCWKFIKKDPKEIKFVSSSFPSYLEMCIYCMKQDNSVIEFISDSLFKTTDISKIVEIFFDNLSKLTKKLDTNLQFFLYHDKTYYKYPKSSKTIEDAIQSNPNNIIYVPKIMPNYSRLLLLASQRNPETLSLLRYHDYQEEYQKDFYLKIAQNCIKINPLAVRYLDPKHPQYPKLIKNCIRKNKLTLNFTSCLNENYLDFYSVTKIVHSKKINVGEFKLSPKLIFGCDPKIKMTIPIFLCVPKFKSVLCSLTFSCFKNVGLYLPQLCLSKIIKNLTLHDMQFSSQK